MKDNLAGTVTMRGQQPRPRLSEIGRQKKMKCVYLIRTSLENPILAGMVSRGIKAL